MALEIGCFFFFWAQEVYFHHSEIETDVANETQAGRRLVNTFNATVMLVLLLKEGLR